VLRLPGTSAGPNKGLELTAKSVRSCLAPAFGSSSPRALGRMKQGVIGEERKV
jgi:hypothetical protein